MRSFYSILFVFFAFVFNGCKQAEETPSSSGETDFFIGTYSRNDSQGIYKSSISEDGKLSQPLGVARVNNPSYLKTSDNGKFLLAVSEQEDGMLLSFRISDSILVPAGKAQTFGAHPCHISIQANEMAIVSNYSGGNIALFRIHPEGQLSFADTLQFTGKGDHPRQEAPHAHSSYFLDRDHLATADLGTDKIRISVIETDNGQEQLSVSDSIVLTGGAGPRHMAFHPSGKFSYVINELNSTISLVLPKLHEPGYSTDQSITTIPESYEGENYCADIHIDNTGKFLYASNRGHQSVAIYEIDQDNGKLTLIGWEDVKGAWPRNFTITPDNRFLIVANEHSGNLVAFKRDLINGTLEYTDQITVPAPVCIAF